MINKDINTNLSNSKKVFLLDIGRVLLDFDFESSLSRLIPSSIKNPEERIKHVLSKKDILEAGLITPEYFAQWALAVLNSDVTIEQFYQVWQQIFTVNELMWQCIRKLACDGHRLILISNINAIHCPWIFSTYPDFIYFEATILSFNIGMLKPQPEIFQYAIDTYKLPVESVIYVDDMPQNIITGKKFGFKCWQYDINYHQVFEAWLEELMFTKKL